MPVPACYSNIPEYGCDGTVFSLLSYGAPYTEIPQLFRVIHETPHPFITPELPRKEYPCNGMVRLKDLVEKDSCSLSNN